VIRFPRYPRLRVWLPWPLWAFMSVWLLMLWLMLASAWLCWAALYLMFVLPVRAAARSRRGRERRTGG
jgi:hypothetical protein